MRYHFEESGEIRKMTGEELVIADANTAIIILDRGTTPDDRACWVYVAVKPSRYKDFMRAVRMHENKNYKDYGEVLKFGYGEEVPVSIKEEMMRDYGCNENYMENLAKDIRQARKTFLQEKEDKKIKEFLAEAKRQTNI